MLVLRIRMIVIQIFSLIADILPISVRVIVKPTGYITLNEILSTKNKGLLL